MQLTMSILADGLANYRLETSIRKPAGELTGIRLGPGHPGDLFVHLSQDGDDVVCCSGQDCIWVFKAEVHEVFNTISAVAEQLQQWENRLNEIIYGGGGLDSLIQCSSPILGNPIFIVDERDIVFAMTDHPAGTVDPEWDHMLQYGRMPYNRISAIYHESDFKRLRRASEYDNEPFIFQPPGAVTRGINFRIPDPAADSFLGTMCVVESQTRLTEGQVHKTRILIQAIIKWTRLHQHDHNMKNISHLFTELLNGVKIDDSEIAMTKSLNDMESDLFILAVIPPEFADRLVIAAPVLEHEISRSLCFEYENSLLMLCVYDQDQKIFCDTLQEIALDLQVRIGISYPFSDWRALRSAFKQANIALDYSRERLSRLNSQSAMSYLFSELSQTLQGSNIFHPALQILHDYDHLHSTQYFNTLYVYLKHERNLVSTAAALYIHRNSLVYRIGRIQELIDVDLDDYAVRHYLLLSYQCHENGKRK
ncbi:MAG TPA: hypothetical protein DCM45_00455 [Clostridiales bacterium]|nr:hypothetical protein [Clostridiales bacterium]